MDSKQFDSVTLTDLFGLIKRHIKIYLFITIVSFLIIFFRIKFQYSNYHVQQNFFGRIQTGGMDLVQANQLRKALEKDPEILNEILLSMPEASYTLEQLQKMLKVKIGALEDYTNHTSERVPQFRFTFSVVSKSEKIANDILENWVKVALKYIEVRNQDALQLESAQKKIMDQITPRCDSEELTRSKSSLTSLVKELEKEGTYYAQKFKEAFTKGQLSSVDWSYFSDKSKKYSDLLNQLERQQELYHLQSDCERAQSIIHASRQKIIYFKPIGSSSTLLTPADYLISALIVGLGASLLGGFLVLAIYEQWLQASNK